MRLALGARVTAKMLGHYAEQVAVSSLENPKIWDTFKICMLEESKNMDSKDSIRILKSIYKISEKLESDHYKDLLKLTYNKIESHILTFPPTDLALILSVAAKVGHVEDSLVQSLSIAFSSRLVQATSQDVLVFVKNLRLLNVDKNIYDEIIKYLYKCCIIFPTSDLVTILFYCLDCDIYQILEKAAEKVSKAELSNDLRVKALYLYSINQLPCPIGDVLVKEIALDDTYILPHLIYSSAIYSIGILHLKEKVLECLEKVDAISKLIIIYSLSLNALKTGRKSVFYTFFKKKIFYFHQIFIQIYSNLYIKFAKSPALLYLLEAIALFANVYSGAGDNVSPNPLRCLFNKILNTLDKNADEVEWVKRAVPHVWLENDGHEIQLEDIKEEKKVVEFQTSYINNLELLRKSASSLDLFAENFPFDVSDGSSFDAAFIIPDIKLAAEQLGQTSIITHGKKELLVLMDSICFVPLSPIHFIDGTTGTDPEIELPDTIIRHNVRESISKLSKQYKVALVPYWKWSTLEEEAQQLEYLMEVVDKLILP